MNDYRNAPDYYAVLEVAKTASQEEIKSSYRKLAKQWHPDRHQDNKAAAEEKFKAIGEAYSVLSDETKRKDFDNRNNHSHRNFWGQTAVWPDDIDSFIRAHRPPPRGRDVRGSMGISLKEAVIGCSKTIRVPKTCPCKPCTGTGAKDNQFSVCGSCGGTGKQVIHAGTFVRTTACYRCAGNGRTPKEKCPPCSGTGRTMTEVMLEVEIPAGIHAGAVLVARGQGEEGPGGPGDVHVVLNVEADPKFTRDGDCLLTTIEIPMEKAMLGGDVCFQWIDGSNLSIAIPEMCPNGKVFEIAGKGAAYGAPLIVQTSYSVPSSMSKEDRATVASVFAKYK